jgi:hypothetical protein
MRFNSVKGGDYSSGARAVNRNSDAAFDASRKSSFNFTGVSNAAIAARSTERRAAMKAENLKDTTQIKADTLVQGTQLKVDTDKAVADIKRPAKRMAGVVAGLGTLATTGAMMAQDKRDKAEDAKYRAASDARWAKRQEEKLELLRSGRNNDTDTIEPFKPTPFPEFKPSGGTTDTTKSGGGLVSSGQAVAAGKGTPSKGGKYDLTAMTDFAIQGGFSPTDARTMAAISMGESSGDAGIDTVQSGLDPNQTNEFSVGLAQINVQAHSDKLKRRGWTHEDLRDPVKNMTIAKEVYDEVGSFKPWSVYQKGLHTQYLK